MSRTERPLILRRLLAEVRAAVPRHLDPESDNYLPADQPKAAEYQAQLKAALQNGRVQASLRRAIAQTDFTAAAEILRRELRLKPQAGLGRSELKASSSVLVHELISGLGVAVGLPGARTAKQFNFAGMIWWLLPTLIPVMLFGIGKVVFPGLPDWIWAATVAALGFFLLLFIMRYQFKRMAAETQRPLGFDFHFAVNAVELHQLIKRELAAELAAEEELAWKGGPADAQRHLAGVLAALKASTELPGLEKNIERQIACTPGLAEFRERLAQSLPGSGFVESLQTAARSGAVQEEDFVARAGHAFGVCDGPQFYSPEIMTYNCLMQSSAGKLMQDYGSPQQHRKAMWKSLLEWPLLQVLTSAFALIAIPILIWREPLEKFMMAGQTNNYLVTIAGLLLFVGSLLIGFRIHPGFRSNRRLLGDSVYALTMLSLQRYVDEAFASERSSSPQVVDG